MKIEFELDDAELKERINVSIKDYVLDHRMLHSLCRQAIYTMVASAAEVVLKDHKAELSELVIKELKNVVLEGSDYR